MTDSKHALADSTTKYNSIDLGKFVMALCVIAIHTYPLANCTNPVVLVIYDSFVEAAVPFFFLATGYLLAVRMQWPYDSQESIGVIRNYLFKILKLYLIWSAVYFPLAIYDYIITGRSVISSVSNYIQGLVFIGEHYNSWMLWYLLSAIYALIFILICLRCRVSPYVILAAGIIILFIGAGLDVLMPSEAVLSVFLQQLRKFISHTIANGRVLRGAFYIPCGMILARKKPNLWISGIVFLAAFTGRCMISPVFIKSILVAVYAAALFTVTVRIKLKNSELYPILRKMSTVMYFTHMYVWTFYYFIVYLHLGKTNYGADSFFVTTVICFIMAGTYIYIRDKERYGSSKLVRLAAWKPDRRLVAVGAAVILVLLLVPLLRIALYSTPWHDDYIYGKFVKDFLDQKYSLKSALDGAVSCVKTQWYAWQGCFSSIFFMSMVPMVWAEELYFLGPVFLILILSASVCVLVKVLVRDILKADWAFVVTLQCITAAVAVVLIHTPQEGFFWYNSGINYVGMHAFLLLLIAAWIKLISGAGKVSSALLVLWTLVGAILAGGSNFVTALQGLLIGLSLAVLGVLLRNRKTVFLAPSLLIYIFAFYKNVSAPGNNVHREVLREIGLGMAPLSAVAQSFAEAFRYLGSFTGWMTLAVMVLIAPIIWHAVRKLNFRYRYPGLLFLWSFCLYVAGFMAGLHSLGRVGMESALNALKITFQLLLIVNEVYWIGWICERRTQEEKSDAVGEPPFLFYPVMGLVILLIFAIDPGKENHYSSYTAYHYVHSGEAYNYYHEYLQRVDTIKNGGDEIVVEPYLYRPWILCVGDLTEDSFYETNREMADWYGKESVSCRLPNPE